MSADVPIAIPRGFRAAATRAGIKPSGGLDLAVLVADSVCSAAGTFTTNRVCAAPVKWDRARLPSDRIRAIVINAGNANAATGQTGDDNVRRTATVAAELIDCEVDEVLVASTGVIGRQLPMESLENGLRTCMQSLSPHESRFHEASRAIMTTDTRPKIVSTRQVIRGDPVTLLGLAKGAAMIGPRMATMLAFFLTDAPVGPGVMQGILAEAVEDSFNCISVEGHTSTNDTVLMLGGGPNRLPLKGPELDAFATMVRESCINLARMIPDDGEGANHFITIDVEGCLDRAQARAIAEAVANSALVKTAIHGADPNWGRIVSAAGYSGVMFEESQLSLWLNGFALYRDGAPLDFEAANVSASLRNERNVHIRLALTLGTASIRFWTCDLTSEYVRLNADYTT
jgi:glutamate N-acetyltransferase/amino-acid N-acetyltransferase